MVSHDYAEAGDLVELEKEGETGEVSAGVGREGCSVSRGSGHSEETHCNKYKSI